MELSSHTHTHTHAHAHTHTRTRIHTHKHTHTLSRSFTKTTVSLFLPPSFPLCPRSLCLPVPFSLFAKGTYGRRRQLCRNLVCPELAHGSPDGRQHRLHAVLRHGLLDKVAARAQRLEAPGRAAPAQRAPHGACLSEARWRASEEEREKGGLKRRETRTETQEREGERERKRYINMCKTKQTLSGERE